MPLSIRLPYLSQEISLKIEQVSLENDKEKERRLNDLIHFCFSVQREIIMLLVNNCMQLFYYVTDGRYYVYVECTV